MIIRERIGVPNTVKVKCRNIFPVGSMLGEAAGHVCEITFKLRDE